MNVETGIDTVVVFTVSDAIFVQQEVVVYHACRSSMTVRILHTSFEREVYMVATHACHNTSPRASQASQANFFSDEVVSGFHRFV